MPGPYLLDEIIETELHIKRTTKIIAEKEAKKKLTGIEVVLPFYNSKLQKHEQISDPLMGIIVFHKKKDNSSEKSFISTRKSMYCGTQMTKPSQ